MLIVSTRIFIDNNTQHAIDNDTYVNPSKRKRFKILQENSTKIPKMLLVSSSSGYYTPSRLYKKSMDYFKNANPYN